MAKEISIVQLADMVKGRIVGSPDRETILTGTCSADNYISDRVSFVRSRKHGELLANMHNGVVLIPEGLADLCEKYPQNIYVVVEDVVNSLMDMQDFFHEEYPSIEQEGICATARIENGANIGDHAYIGENVYIGQDVRIGERTKVLHNSCILENVEIGSATHIYPGVCVYRNTTIGDDCIIHSGARIGVDGFRFEQDVQQKIVRKMHHAGKVVIGDRVEIGANTVIDRATFPEDATIISNDVKVDNLVHIAHNAKIGARSLIVAQTCIGGSTTVGEDVWIGIGAAISDNIRVGNGAKVLLNAVVAYDVPEGEIVSGFYAMPHRRWKQVYKKLKEEI